MDFSYEKLYTEYENAIIVQNDMIKRKREDLKNAHRNSNHKEIKRLNSLLLVLAAEKSELEERVKGLRELIS